MQRLPATPEALYPLHDNHYAKARRQTRTRAVTAVLIGWPFGVALMLSFVQSGDVATKFFAACFFLVLAAAIIAGLTFS